MTSVSEHLTITVLKNYSMLLGLSNMFVNIKILDLYDNTFGFKIG